VDEPEGSSMNSSTDHNDFGLRAGDVIEITVRGERRTAEVMIVSEDDQLLLDLFDGDRPVFARASTLTDVAVYRPDAGLLVAA
jgi:bifunctional DNA-binding transcriptional regulator/antitoxin component of YhaV-PrlF toxin-antitoxin module